MKKSVEILGLPVISITEGRELGISKGLLIDAKNRVVAAITIEDDEWYRGVKLIPYEAVIAIGVDAMTITHSENILTLDDAGDYEALLDENIRIIGTKVFTKSGVIQGKVSEISIAEDGRIEMCEITDNEGAVGEIPSDKISIFGKLVTVIETEAEKKTKFIEPPPAEEPVSTTEEPAETSEESTQHAEVEGITPINEEPAPSIEEVQNDSEETQESEVASESETESENNESESGETQESESESEPAPETVESVKNTPKVTQQAEALKAALRRAQANQKSAKNAPVKKGDKAVDDRRRTMLLGKKAARTITADNGDVIVAEGAEITEEVLQKAKLANKYIELSMNYA